MAHHAARIQTLQDRLARHRQRVALLRLVRHHAERLAEHFSRRADGGWLSSIVTNTGGTLLAVLSGAEARRCVEQANEAQELLTEAQLDQRLVEIELEQLQSGDGA